MIPEVNARSVFLNIQAICVYYVMINVSGRFSSAIWPKF